MTKPDYIAKIEVVALELQSAQTPLERRILEAWDKYERLAERLGYDILFHDPRDQDRAMRDLRDHSRVLITLLYEVHPGAAVGDCEQIRKKDAAYGGSWHRRGGTGAFHALARKGDRIVEQFRLYETINRARVEDSTESIDDTLGDLRRYLILVEAWHIARCTKDSPKLSSEGQQVYNELKEKFSTNPRVSQSDASTPEEAEKRLFGDKTEGEDIPF